MHFAENQLAPGSIGISPLPTAHPMVLQHQRVRASVPASVGTSPCPWVARPVSGLLPVTKAATSRQPPAARNGFRWLLCAGRWRLNPPYSDSLSLRLLPQPGLTSPPTATRRLIIPNARSHPAGGGTPTACRHTVSGSVSLPFRGSFHLSLTVLVHYRSPGVFSLIPWSGRIPTGFHVSRGTWGRHRKSASFRIRGCHPLWRTVPSRFR